MHILMYIKLKYNINRILKSLRIWVWKREFQLIHIQDPLDMNFNAAIVFVTIFLLLFRLGLTIL